MLEDIRNLSKYIDIENADKVRVFELVVGVFLLIISFIGTIKAFQKFGFLAVGHFSPTSVPISTIRPIWEKTLALVLRMIMISFVGGALTAHGAMGIIRQGKGEVGKIEVKKGDAEISIGSSVYKIELLKKDAPKTCEAFKNALPIEGKIKLHGKEAYFATPIEVGPENQTLNPKKGDVCYYPSSKAVSIFLESSKPAAPVNVFGRIVDKKKIKAIEGDKVKVERPDQYK